MTDDIYSLKEKSRISAYPICLTSPPRFALLVIDFLPHFLIIIAI